MNTASSNFIMSMDPAWWLALPPALTIAMIAIAARLLQGSWLAPGAAWAGFWTGATWLPLLLAPNYPVSPTAIWIIAGFVAVFFVFSGGGRRKQSVIPSTTRVDNRVGRMRPMHFLCVVGFAGSIAAAALTLAEFNASWDILLHADSMVEVSRRISEARYGGEITESLVVRAMFALTYLGALAGGHAMAWRKPGSNMWVAIAPLAGALLYTLLTTAKAGILFSMIFWLAAFATETIHQQRRAWRIDTRLLYRGVLGSLLVITLFIIAMLLRYGFDHANDPGFLLEQLRNYTCAHLTVFSSWWDSSMRTTEQVGWGKVSFFGQTALLGLTDRQQGVYQVIISDRYFVDSNICTLYRGLIADFTLPGALIVSALAAYLSGQAYRRILRGSHTSSSIILLTAFYSVLLSSHVVNMFGYSTLMLAFLSYGLFCSVSARLVFIKPTGAINQSTPSQYE